MINPKLKEAIAIFEELGWGNATPENVLDLPLGTAEQKKTALAGLKSGEWMWWRRDHWVTPALYAIRLGVDARRVVSAGAFIDTAASLKMFLAVIAERGQKYAASFVEHVCALLSRRNFTHDATLDGCLAVWLVDKFQLEIPQSAVYINEWSFCATSLLGGATVRDRVHYEKECLPTQGQIVKRFAEHIRIGVAVGTPATGPFGRVLPEGVKRGLLSRAEATELLFTALDAAVRPSDHKVWLSVLEEIGVTDDEMVERAQALIPLLATGEGAMILRLAPKLIPKVDATLLPEVLIAAFSATAANARQTVLRCALARPRPQEAESLTPWLLILAADRDRRVASLAARLSAQWGIAVEASSASADGAGETLGLWQETPPVWALAPFELGEVSPETLTELAAEIMQRSASEVDSNFVPDVATERLLALANAVAHQDRAAARASLRGLRSNRGEMLLQYLACWVKGGKHPFGGDNPKTKGFQRYALPLEARDYVVCQSLGAFPCLLSMPSSVDLSIRVSDLVERLACYREKGMAVLEPDLFLALTRLDGNTLTAEDAAALSDMDIPVVLPTSDTLSGVSAGKVALAYLEDPVQEPPLSLHEKTYWKGTAWGVSLLVMPESLRDFPDRFNTNHSKMYTIFPRWGDAVMTGLRWKHGEADHESGLVMRQMARRALPLPPGAAINMLGTLRSVSPDAKEDAWLAVREAWQRGLLRPGVADLAFLSWQTDMPLYLSTWVPVLEGIARDGMLSVAWPILDHLIQASLQARRLLAGTDEVAELVAAFLPEVQNAVERGLAERTALALPGIRALAARGGSSRAVSAARQVVERLSRVTKAPEAVKKSVSRAVKSPPFDDIWYVPKNPLPLIEDGVKVTADWLETTPPKKQFCFTLSLPDIRDFVFRTRGYGLEWAGFNTTRRMYFHNRLQEQWLSGLCDCEPIALTSGAQRTDWMETALNPTDDREEGKVWLHWDAMQQKMVVCEKRNWAEKEEGRFTGSSAPLSAALCVVLIGELAQEGEEKEVAFWTLAKLIERDVISADVVRHVMRVLLQSPAVRPSRLVRALEKKVELLSTFWPMLTEGIRHAGAEIEAGGKSPVWINRILEVSLWYAPYLVEAAKRGHIPAEDAKWTGLAAIAAYKAKSSAVGKARDLLTALGKG